MISELIKKAFYEHTNKVGDCLVWKGGNHGNGYAAAHVFGKQFYAHRLSWEITNGPIPAGKMLCHTCDNKKCVNPEHLFVGTTHDNNRDYLKKKRNDVSRDHFPPKFHEKNGGYYYVHLQEGKRIWTNLGRDYLPALERYYEINS